MLIIDYIVIIKILLLTHSVIHSNLRPRPQFWDRGGFKMYRKCIIHILLFRHDFLWIGTYIQKKIFPKTN